MPVSTSQLHAHAFAADLDSRQAGKRMVLLLKKLDAEIAKLEKDGTKIVELEEHRMARHKLHEQLGRLRYRGAGGDVG